MIESVDMKIYVLTRVQRGPCGHGEPGEEYLTLMLDKDGYDADVRHPAPAFLSRGDAVSFKREYGGSWQITELEVEDSGTYD
jgi:hypothetical protein